MSMNVEQIKTAVDEGKDVFWKNSDYRVIKDKLGQYLIYCRLNEHCIGLTWSDGKTLNGSEFDFYMPNKYNVNYTMIFEGTEEIFASNEEEATELFWAKYRQSHVSLGQYIDDPKNEVSLESTDVTSTVLVE